MDNNNEQYKKNPKDQKDKKLKILILIFSVILVGLIIFCLRYKIYDSVMFIKNYKSYKEESEKYRESSDFLKTLQGEKPIIYIYPTETIDVNIKLGKKENLSCTYPKYYNGWNVTANPDGTLIDNNTGRKLYALYWEGRNLVKDINMNEGFCIKGEDTIKFLEEKLEILCLNEREAEEFIIYWLPKMENNKYNYIRFETIEEQNIAMPLDINPKPDTLIRIMMDWKGLENRIEVKEQNLTPTKREGYTVVEWGGSELK